MALMRVVKGSHQEAGSWRGAEVSLAGRGEGGTDGGTGELGEEVGVDNLSPGADESQVSPRPPSMARGGGRTKRFHLRLCVQVTQRRRGPVDSGVCLED